METNAPFTMTPSAFRLVVDRTIPDVWELSRRMTPDDDSAVLAVLRTFLRARQVLEHAGPFVNHDAVVLEVCAGVCREFRVAQRGLLALPA